jgi:hypothetical protein
MIPSVWLREAFRARKGSAKRRGGAVRELSAIGCPRVESMQHHEQGSNIAKPCHATEVPTRL